VHYLHRHRNLAHSLNEHKIHSICSTHSHGHVVAENFRHVVVEIFFHLTVMAQFTQQEHLRILNEHQSEYDSALSEAAQKDVLKTIVKALRAARRTGLPKSVYKVRSKIFMLHVSQLVQAVANWYSVQRGEEEEEDGAPKWTKKWNLRKVTAVMKREEIDGIIGEDAGSPKYLRGYAKAVNEVLEELTDEETKEYMQKAKEWNESSPPVDIQMR